VQGTNGINLEKKKNLRPKILHLKKRHVRTRPESAGSLHLDRPRAHAYACIYPSSAGRIRAPPPPLASPCAVWTEAKRFPPIDGFSGSSTAHRGEGRLHCVVCVEASSQVVAARRLNWQLGAAFIIACMYLIASMSELVVAQNSPLHACCHNNSPKWLLPLGRSNQPDKTKAQVHRTSESDLQIQCSLRAVAKRVD
jgi:hypothetical protein